MKHFVNDKLTDDPQPFSDVIEGFTKALEVVANTEKPTSSGDYGDFWIYDSEYSEPIEGGQSVVKRYMEIGFRIIVYGGKFAILMKVKDTSALAENLKLTILNDYKNRLLTTLAHQLRTPLNLIIPLLNETAEDSEISRETREQFIHPALANAKMLKYLIQDILDYSRWNLRHLSIIKKEFLVKDFVDELKSLFMYQAKIKGVQFNIKVSGNIPERIYSDSQKLLQILINLLANSFKFTTTGAIAVEIDIVGGEEVSLSFTVSDTGIGIPPKTLNVMNQLFGTSSIEDYDQINTLGIGLGTKVAHLLVKLLESRGLEVSSDVSKGTEFRFIIPLQDSPAMQSFTTPWIEDENSSNVAKQIEMLKSPQPRTSLANFSDHKYIVRNHTTMQPTRSYSILIVDDNEMNIYALKKLLEKKGLEIYTAANGVIALQIMEDLLKTQTKGTSSKLIPSLIIMDVDMPEMNGFQTTLKLRAQMANYGISNIPIVFHSALIDESNWQQRAINVGGERVFLNKPFYKTELERVLQLYLPKFFSPSHKKSDDFLLEHSQVSYLTKKV